MIIMNFLCANSMCICLNAHYNSKTKGKNYSLKAKFLKNKWQVKKLQALNSEYFFSVLNIEKWRDAMLFTMEI